MGGTGVKRRSWMAKEEKTQTTESEKTAL